jgi:hypothetical protein
MTDYTYPAADDLSDKDALAANDPEKTILGTDLEAEFTAIATAIATKYDSSDLATQAQAEAGVNNTTLMTPLRVAQALQGTAGGVLSDLLALADPGADSLLFWDESSNTTTWLTLDSSLTITGTTLSASAGAIDHDSLSGFVANEHIDMSGVVLTAGSALSYSAGGTDMTASATLDVDVTELTAGSAFDFDNDLLLMYDASATANVKVTPSDLLGDVLGDGKWYRSSAQATSAATEATIAYNAAEYDQLQRGTFSTSTGEYTVGAAAARIHISCLTTIAAINDDDSIEIEIQVGGVTKLRTYYYNDTDNDAPEHTMVCAGNLNLAAADVVRVRVTTSSAESVSSGTEKTSVSIVELG